MKRSVRVCALLAVFAMAPACLPFDVFEDVGTSPHQPQVQLLGIGYQPIEYTEDTITQTTSESGETVTETVTETITPKPVFYDPKKGFLVYPSDDKKNTLILKVKYADVGGDITMFTIRDNDSDLNTGVTPSAVETDIDGDGVLETLDASEYFTGTSGTVNLEEIKFTSTQKGTHRLELWAVDSHESRSVKVEFTVTVVL